MNTEINKTKSFKLFIYVLLSILGVMLIYFYINSSGPFPDSVEVIEIQNGKTGQVFSLEETEAQEFLKQVSIINFENGGIKGWTSGYTYRIKCIDSDNEITTVVVHSKNTLSQGIKKYNTNDDIVKFIKDYCEK